MQNYLELENRLLSLLFFYRFTLNLAVGTAVVNHFNFCLFAFHAGALLLLTAYVFSQRKFRIPEDQTIDF